LNGNRVALTQLTTGLLVLWGLATASLMAIAFVGETAFLGWALAGAVLITALARPFPRAGLVLGVVAGLVFFAIQLYQALSTTSSAVQNNGLALSTIGSSLSSLVDPTRLLLSAVFLLVAGLLGDLVAGQMTGTKAQMEQDAMVIQELTIRDGLTGAMKRSYCEVIFQGEIERARRYKRTFSIVVLTADNWDAVVKDRGRDGAAEVMRVAGDVVMKGVRVMDTVSRYDEALFLVLLPETTGSGAATLVDRMCREIMGLASVRFRGGVAEFPNDGVTKDELMGEAEAAVVFARSMDLNVASRSALV